MGDYLGKFYTFIQYFRRKDLYSSAILLAGDLFGINFDLCIMGIERLGSLFYLNIGIDYGDMFPGGSFTYIFGIKGSTCIMTALNYFIYSNASHNSILLLCISIFNPFFLDYG